MSSGKDIFLRDATLLLHSSFSDAKICRASQQEMVEMMERFMELFISRATTDMTDIHGASFNGHVFLQNMKETFDAYPNTFHLLSTDFKRTKAYTNLGL